MSHAPRSRILVAALTLLAGSAAAQTPSIGQVCDRDGSERDILGSGGELYSIKVDGTRYDDWQANLSAKSGDRLGISPGDVDRDAWQVLGGNFTRRESSTNVVSTIITFPNGEVYVDNGDLSTGFNFTGAARVQRAGDSSDLPGNAGIAVASGRGERYRASTDDWSLLFPVSTGPGPNKKGIVMAFAPIVELNDANDGGCSWGGVAADPATGHGLFIGFNIYRVEDDGSSPSVADVVQPENFIYFVNIFDEPGDDLSTTHDSDGVPYSGDEVITFVDYVEEPEGRERIVGTPPRFGHSYWYAHQPVVQGSPSDFESVSLAGRPAEDYSVDLTGDGVADAVDLDEAFDNGLEFLSPQADFGLPRLGLTNGGIGLCSELLWGSLDTSDPLGPGSLPAAGDVSLELERVKEGVAIRVRTGLEERDLLGFAIYRLEGSKRVRLHEGPLLARGGTGNVYELVDRLEGRGSRGSGVYLAEVLTLDGGVDQLVGPVKLKRSPRSTARRR